MRAIKFNTVNFDLYGINVTADHLSATVVKGDYTVDDIIEELDGTTTTTISEDGETVAVYNGYSKILAVTYYKDYEHEDPVDIVSVELINEDLQQQINDLLNTVENVQSTVTSVQNFQNFQSEAIDNLSNEVSGKLDTNVIGDVEDIGEKAKRSYKIDETFMGSNGKYYKAIVPIITGTILTVGGNCEETSISEELKVEE